MKAHHKQTMVVGQSTTMLLFFVREGTQRLMRRPLRAADCGVGPKRGGENWYLAAC